MLLYTFVYLGVWLVSHFPPAFESLFCHTLGHLDGSEIGVSSWVGLLKKDTTKNSDEKSSDWYFRLEMQQQLWTINDLALFSIFSVMRKSKFEVWYVKLPNFYGETFPCVAEVTCFNKSFLRSCGQFDELVFYDRIFSTKLILDA